MWTGSDILRALRGERATVLKEWREAAQQTLWHLGPLPFSRRGALTLCAEATLQALVAGYEAQVEGAMIDDACSNAVELWQPQSLSCADLVSLLDLLNHTLRVGLQRREAPAEVQESVEGRFHALRCVVATAKLRQSEQELAALKEEFASAQILTGRYLSNLTHEIRTPLTAVLGFTELLLEDTYGELKSEQRTAIQHIENSGRNLEEILNNMLDLMQIRTGKFVARVRPIQVLPLLEYLIEILEPLAERKKVRFEASLPETLGTIEADEHLVRHIVYHLISSCLRATPAGGRVHLEAKRTPEALHLIAQDTALALPPDIIETMRNPYLLRENVPARGYDYWEVGLPLVQRYVDLHGGEFHVHSAPTQGTTFEIALPVVPSRPIQAP